VCGRPLSGDRPHHRRALKGGKSAASRYEKERKDTSLSLRLDSAARFAHYAENAPYRPRKKGRLSSRRDFCGETCCDDSSARRKGDEPTPARLDEHSGRKRKGALKFELDQEERQSRNSIFTTDPGPAGKNPASVSARASERAAPPRPTTKKDPHFCTSGKKAIISIIRGGKKGRGARDC